jgi:hypothetical protein
MHQFELGMRVAVLRDHGETGEDLACFRVLPFVPETGDLEHVDQGSSKSLAGTMHRRDP